MFIINLTQHEATADQKAEGVVDLPADQRKALAEALTFEELPSSQETKLAGAVFMRLPRWG